MADFNSLPFPMQLMQMRQMQQQMQQAQQQQEARRGAGSILYGMQPQGAPQGMPPPPAGGPQAPPPGAMSPGGGNPMAPGGASIMAPPQPGMVPPPPPQPMQTGQGGIPDLAQQAGMQRVAPPPIPPFRPMPSAPAANDMAPGGSVPPPPAQAAAQPQGAPAQRPFDLKNIIGSLKQANVPAAQVMNMLDALSPAMTMENKQELDFFKANNQALKAANEAYVKALNAATAGRRVDVMDRAEDRRDDHGQQNIDIKRDRETRLKSLAETAAGGGGGLRTTEYVYPKGANGQPDQAQPPIGVRAITKTGKIINLDAEGHQVPTLAGATAKEGKASQVNVRDTVRGNLVEGSALNAINRLAEIEKAHPNGTVSLIFGKSPGDSVLMGGGHAAMRGMQNAKQQDIDAKWASFIDEVIPVFTGGLRGSDAFRKFLIEQAPQPNAKPEAIKEKMRLFRENIRGTQSAFANKFKADPAMWGPGVTPEQAKGGAAPRGTGPEVGAVQDGYRFKGGDPGKPESWERVQ